MQYHLNRYEKTSNYIYFLLRKKKILDKLATDGNFQDLRENIHKKPTVNVTCRKGIKYELCGIVSFQCEKIIRLYR